MTVQPPEFHTEPTTPISPIPHHPSVPSKFPVLENQVDPVLNLASTHDKSANMASDPDKMDQSASDNVSSSSDENELSDPFESEQEPPKAADSTSAPGGGDSDDDYAMTFESEADNDGTTNEPAIQVTSPGNEQTAPIADPPVPQAPSTVRSATPVSQGAVTSSSVAAPNTTTAMSVSARIEAPTKPYRPSTPPAIYQSIQKGEIDIQDLLDNITANAELKSASNGTAPAIPLPTAAAHTHANLPPRPPIIPNTAMHPGYAPPGYGVAPVYPGPPGVAQMPPSMIIPPAAIAPPGARLDPRSGLPPPPPASFVASPPSMIFQKDPTIPQRGTISTKAPPSRDGSDAGDYQWTRELQKAYDVFLADERQNVSEGVWDRFPVGSRLFIGNLVTEKVSKRDVFYLFHKYGRIAQISIKQAYGFVQFYEISSCSAALAKEQGQELRGRKIHLEISKPQKNSAKAQTNQGQQNAQRRSNTPERMRQSNRGTNNRNHQQNRSVDSDRFDRYDGRGGQQYRDQDHRQGPSRSRDEYRPMRSPSPPRGGYRGRDDRDSNRRGDHYNRDYRRSRSRSPMYDRRDDRRDFDRYRQRSPSPRRPVNEDEALGIPRRAPADVPDVQIFLLEELDRNFIQWTENEIKSRGLKTEVMFLSPRLPVDVVIRRQILEGVTAVVRLTRSAQNASKIPLQVFDRSRGADNVRFDEYENLEPRIAAELVVREKAKVAPAAAPQQYAPQPPSYAQQQQPAAAPAPNLANIVGQLDNATLQKLLGSLGGAAPAPAPAPVQAPPPQQAQSNGQLDLAGILGMLNKQQPQQQSAPPLLQQGLPQNSSAQQIAAQQQQLNSMLAGMGRGVSQVQSQPPAQPSQPNIQDIMAQLARYNK